MVRCKFTLLFCLRLFLPTQRHSAGKQTSPSDFGPITWLLGGFFFISDSTLAARHHWGLSLVLKQTSWNEHCSLLFTTFWTRSTLISPLVRRKNKIHGFWCPASWQLWFLFAALMLRFLASDSSYGFRLVYETCCPCFNMHHFPSLDNDDVLHLSTLISQPAGLCVRSFNFVFRQS